MIINKKEALCSWNYNFGRSYPMSCDKCRASVEMEMIEKGDPFALLKCTECRLAKRKKN